MIAHPFFWQSSKGRAACFCVFLVNSGHIGAEIVLCIAANYEETLLKKFSSVAFGGVAERDIFCCLISIILRKIDY